MDKATQVFNKLAQLGRPAPANPPWHVSWGNNKQQTPWKIPSPKTPGRTGYGGMAIAAKNNILASRKNIMPSPGSTNRLQNLMNSATSKIR